MSRIKQFDHVGITVADLDTATAFFVDLGLEVEGAGEFLEGEFVDTVCGIPDSRTEIVVLRPPGGGFAGELAPLVRPARPRARIAHRDGQRAGSAQHLFRGRRPPGALLH